MPRPFAVVAMLACACLVAIPASAFAQDPAAEVPDIAVSEAQPVTTGPAWGIAKDSVTPELWATVNICDTAKAPNSMGVRASMPGNGTDQRMYMRFQAEYWSRARQDWAPVAGSGISPWVSVGSARYDRRQAGWTFSFAAPPQGVTFTMRAVVEFEWRDEAPETTKRGVRGLKPGKKRGRKRGKRRGYFDLTRAGSSRVRVVRSQSKTTQTGISGVHGGDPAGTSKAMCLIY
jgi:hypothetical protein